MLRSVCVLGSFGAFTCIYLDLVKVALSLSQPLSGDLETRPAPQTLQYGLRLDSHTLFLTTSEPPDSGGPRGYQQHPVRYQVAVMTERGECIFLHLH